MIFIHSPKKSTTRIAVPGSVLVREVIVVIGDDSSETSAAEQLVLQDRDLPQISPSSSADALSDKASYPSFLRVVPSDSERGEVLAYLVRYFNWSEVALIGTADEYGNQGTLYYIHLDT